MSARDVFTAIADPTRRAILDLLREDGALPAGDIAERFAKNSRPGVSRHLRVLRECGLVAARQDGKNQIYELNAKPLRALHKGWLAHFADMQTGSIAALRRRVEPKK